ncbi:hypothetical protein, partial [Pseudomonas aeruginosa]|uniref:hypothetical protein n=2 Tax=Pseudomonas TaxID=286 RepID=UPI00397B1361
MAREYESFSLWISKKLLTESDIAWAQNYLHGKGEISLHGPVDLDRLLKAGVKLEKTDSGRNTLSQLKAAYRTRKSRSTEERSSTGDINPAEQNLSSQNRNYKTLINLADEVLKYEEALKAKLKHSENQIKELKERISKSKKITQKSLNKSKKAAKTLNSFRESPLKNSEIEKIIQDNEEIKELLIDTLNILDPLPPQKRTIRDSDMNRYKTWPTAKA